MRQYTFGLKGTAPLDLCPSQCPSSSLRLPSVCPSSALRVQDTNTFAMDGRMHGYPSDSYDDIPGFTNYTEFPLDYDLNVNSDLFSDAQTPEDHERPIIPNVCKPVRILVGCDARHLTYF